MSNRNILPFASYPHQGRKLLGHASTYSCRHGYGLEFQRLTGQHHCAYCGISLVDRYEDWLTMALDHAIPDNICKSLGVPEDWNQDYSNRVLCCTACNTFDNQYKPQNVRKPTTLEEFYDLRDQVFVERKARILELHKKERAFFETKPWEISASP